MISYQLICLIVMPQPPGFMSESFLLSSGLCTCRSRCLKRPLHPPKLPMAASVLSSFKCQFKCYPREATWDHLILGYPTLFLSRYPFCIVHSTKHHLISLHVLVSLLVVYYFDIYDKNTNSESRDLVLSSSAPYPQQLAQCLVLRLQ